MEEKRLKEFLRTKQDGRLFHREGQFLEFKEQYNFAGLADYFRDFAAFANNKGGVIIFGVTDSPRVPAGLSGKAIAAFEKIDPERISGYLLETFSGHIEWSQSSHEIDGKTFGFFVVHESTMKPIIAKKDEGRDQCIKNGEIYFRYGGRTQKIRYSELQSIIEARVEANNREWVARVREIGASGPQSAAILDLEEFALRRGEEKILVIDDELAASLNFIKEGQFDEKEGE